MRKFNFSALLLVLVLARSASLPAQKAVAMVENEQWSGNFTGHGTAETLTLKGGVLYFSDEQTPIHPIGDLRGFAIGKGGLHVLNLDGNAADQLNLAYYDPTQDKWFRGMLNERALLTWQAVEHRSGGYTPLQVGTGATLYPEEQVTQATELSAKSSVAAPVPAPLDYPVEGVQYTALTASQHMWTHFLITADGTVIGLTRVKEDTLFGGFHGVATVSLYSTYSSALPLTQVSSPSIGVSGTVWGHSDVSQAWMKHIDANSLSRLRYYAVVQLWEPNWLTVINDLVKFAAAASKIIEPLTTVGKVIAGK